MHLRVWKPVSKTWLCDNGLILNGIKSQAIVIRSSSLCAPITIKRIDICGQLVATSAVVRDLGFAIDAKLSMAAQVANVCRSAYYHLYRISRIRHTLKIGTTKCLVHALVTSRIDYGNAMLYGISDRLLHCLELVQHSAARVVLRIRRGDRHSMTAALKQLHWLPVKWRVEYNLLVLVFRALHDRTSTYLASLLMPYVPRRAFRSADRVLLTVPRHYLERYGRRSFPRAGPTLWNTLPEELRLIDNMNTFKARLKTHYFKLAFNI